MFCFVFSLSLSCSLSAIGRIFPYGNLYFPGSFHFFFTPTSTYDVAFFSLHKERTVTLTACSRPEDKNPESSPPFVIISCATCTGFQSPPYPRYHDGLSCSSRHFLALPLLSCPPTTPSLVRSYGRRRRRLSFSLSFTRSQGAVCAVVGRCCAAGSHRSRSSSIRGRSESAASHQVLLQFIRSTH